MQQRIYDLILDITNVDTVDSDIVFFQHDFEGSIINFYLRKNNFCVDIDDGTYILELLKTRQRDEKCCRDKPELYSIVVLSREGEYLSAILTAKDLAIEGKITGDIVYQDSKSRTTLGRFQFRVLKNNLSIDTQSSEGLGAYVAIMQELATLKERQDTTDTKTSELENKITEIEAEISEHGVTGEVDPIFTAEKDTLATKEEMQEGANKTEEVIQEVIDNFKWRE